MNSSAITNSVMPTVSIPGTNPSERKGSGFGDVMASITDNWSEQSHQVKYDAAKSAQKNFDDRRSDMDAERSARDERSINEARSEDRREEDPVRASHDDYEDHDDHAKIDDPKSDEPRDVEANPEDDRAGEDMETADGGDRSNDNEAAPQDGENTASASDETTSAESDDTKSDGDSSLTADAGMVDPNQPAQAVPLPGSPEAIELAKAEAAKMKAAGANGAANAQNAALANGQAATGAANGNATADSTTDGLMNSTALSQPAAASSAKMALNGADAGAGDEMSSDKFLSRVVDSMTGDGKGKTDATGTTNAATSRLPQPTRHKLPRQHSRQWLQQPDRTHKITRPPCRICQPTVRLPQLVALRPQQQPTANREVPTPCIRPTRVVRPRTPHVRPRRNRFSSKSPFRSAMQPAKALTRFLFSFDRNILGASMSKWKSVRMAAFRVSFRLTHAKHSTCCVRTHAPCSKR